MYALRRHPFRCQVLVAFFLAPAACARHQEADRPSFTFGRGHFVWTDSTLHEANRLSYHTRCGSALHVWVRDTLSPIPLPHMIIAVLGFEAIAHATPTYPDFSHPFPQTEWAQAQLYSADTTQEATVLGQLRFDSVAPDYVAGRLSGRLVWHTQWDRADTSGSIILDFRAPRHGVMERYLCKGPRM
jgi:hypothetical protein